MASSIASERKAQSDRLRLQTVARTLCDRPAQTDEAHSAPCEHHEDMRNVRGAPRVIGRAHLSGLLPMFERAVTGWQPPPNPWKCPHRRPAVRRTDLSKSQDVSPATHLTRRATC